MQSGITNFIKANNVYELKPIIQVGLKKRSPEDITDVLEMVYNEIGILEIDEEFI